MVDTDARNLNKAPVHRSNTDLTSYDKVCECQAAGRQENLQPLGQLHRIGLDFKRAHVSRPAVRN